MVNGNREGVVLLYFGAAAAMTRLLRIENQCTCGNR